MSSRPPRSTSRLPHLSNEELEKLLDQWQDSEDDLDFSDDDDVADPSYILEVNENACQDLDDEPDIPSPVDHNSDILPQCSETHTMANPCETPTTTTVDPVPSTSSKTTQRNTNSQKPNIIWKTKNLELNEDQIKFRGSSMLPTEILQLQTPFQIYKGLDVVTAKASRQERELATHHLLDILEPHQMFTVVDFRNRALKIMDNLTQQSKIPIIVGGTNYYIESIVYKILVEDMDDTESLLWGKSRRKRDFESDHTYQDQDDLKKKKTDTDTDNVKIDTTDTKQSTSDEKRQEDKEIIKERLQNDVINEKEFSNEEIHAKLASVDPVMAARLHPNNRRKVLRSIEVFLKTGRLHSEILADQKLSEGQLRKPGSTIIFWLKCEQSVHDKRLDDRVDAMLREGLIQELLDFHDRHNKQRIQDGNPPDYTKGIFQTLGFKEFHEYLMLPADQRETEEGRKLLQQSIENMKMATRRYARRQNKMVRGRFLEHPLREVPPVYELDTTDVAQWEENVRSKAEKIIESFLNGSPCEYEPLKINIDEEKKKIDGNSRNYCDVCERLLIGDKTYEIHLKSHRHMKVLKKKKKLEAKINQDKQDV